MNFSPIGPTDMLNTFQDIFKIGQSSLMKPAMSLLSILSLITLTWSALQWTFDEGGNALKELLRKVIFIGFFIWFVKEFPWLVEQAIKGFIWAGTKAGGANNVSLMENPSEIMMEGFRTIGSLMNAVAIARPWELPSFITNFLLLLLIILCYVIIAIQVFLVQVEFGIIATLGLILVPFGVLNQTSFIAEKVFGAIISFGVKLMVLAFILSIQYPILKRILVPEKPELWVILNTLVCSAMLAFLCVHAPTIAAGLISGSPSLSYQNVTSTASKVFNTVRQVVTAAAAGGPAGATAAAAKSVVQEAGNVVAGAATTGSATRTRSYKGSSRRYRGRS